MENIMLWVATIVLIIIDIPVIYKAAKSKGAADMAQLETEVGEGSFKNRAAKSISLLFWRGLCIVISLTIIGLFFFLLGSSNG